MARQGSVGRLATAGTILALLGSSVASAAPRTVDPLVALSVFGSSSSRAAVCAGGAQAAAAAGAAVAAQAGAQPGCVLPMVDAAPPPVAESVPMGMAPVAPVGSGSALGMLPLLLGLAAIAGAAALLLAGNNDPDDDIRVPLSP